LLAHAPLTGRDGRGKEGEGTRFWVQGVEKRGSSAFGGVRPGEEAPRKGEVWEGEEVGDGGGDRDRKRLDVPPARGRGLG